MIALLLALSSALATPGFDPTAPAARFTGDETFTIDGAAKLWSAIERLEDPDRTLFTAEAYNDSTRWPAAAAWAPFVADAFGTGEPGTHAALLHMGPAEEVGAGTPILFVPGAGDNASRGFVTMATRMDRRWRPVYALTFAHPHGDAFKHAEAIANAIARIRARTGADVVDVVAHSKGGIAAAIYLSNAPGTAWGDAAYEAVGTRYREDVRRAVFIATPLAGIDTAFRWPTGNLASLEADTALAPTSWATWYPYGTTAPAFTTDLRAQDFHPDEGDLFPGHRQLLARQPYALPGSMPWLGAYALQPDWYTTYEGGYGFQSYSRGIDAAIDDGGGLIQLLSERGVDPGVELFVLAGRNPLMPNGAHDFAAETFDEAWAEMATESANTWSDLVADAVGDSLISVGISEDEARGLATGHVILGEITGESDGLVFVTSATATAALTHRGAEVVEVKVANLSHLDLLYASPITGDLLIAEAEVAPENAWMRAFGERYKAEDTLGWVERVLADDDVPVDTGEPVDDTGEPVDDDTGAGGDIGQAKGCEGCASGGAPGLAFTWLPLLALLRRRSR